MFGVNFGAANIASKMPDTGACADGACRADKLVELKGFVSSPHHLGVVQRPKPHPSSDDFFAKLKQAPSFHEMRGMVRKRSATEDIIKIVGDLVPEELLTHSFFQPWLADMATVTSFFCDVLGTEAVTFWVGSIRRCKKFHFDAIPFRALVTCSGVGTEWVPNFALHREAFVTKAPSDVFITGKSAIQFLNQWDVALFRGGPNGVVHRTLATALGSSSVFM